jgi:hypothetical protein
MVRAMMVIDKASFEAAGVPVYEISVGTARMTAWAGTEE